MFVKRGHRRAAADRLACPGVVQHTRDSLRKAAAEAVAGRGRRADAVRRARASKDADRLAAATDPDGILNVALRDLVAEVGDATVLMADLCLDEFTDHGHCGVLAADGERRQRRHPGAVRRDGGRAGRGRGARGRRRAG